MGKAPMLANAAGCWVESLAVGMALVGSGWHATRISMNDIGADGWLQESGYSAGEGYKDILSPMHPTRMQS